MRHGVLHRREGRADGGVGADLRHRFGRHRVDGVQAGRPGRARRVVAHEALGLTDEEATALFDGDNELADVEEWVELIISGDFNENDWLNRRDQRRQELEHS